jgi:hypothetical protein
LTQSRENGPNLTALFVSSSLRAIDPSLLYDIVDPRSYYLDVRECAAKYRYT